jgi:hypothetical protein
MSGGRATFALRKGKDANTVSAHSGDISAISSEGEPLTKVFFIECKSYKDFKLDMVVFGSIGELRICWYQPLEEAQKYKKEPLVVLKQNNKDPIVLLTDAGLKIMNSCLKSGYSIPVYAIFPRSGINVVPFRDLLISVSYEKFVELYGKKSS